MAYDDDGCEHLKLMSPEIDKRLAVRAAAGLGATSSSPTRPASRSWCPGQVIKADTIEFMRKLDVKEIHGYDAQRSD